jgi:hypothetical protein
MTGINTLVKNDHDFDHTIIDMYKRLRTIGPYFNPPQSSGEISMRTKLSVVALSVAAAFALSACGQKEEPKPAATPATPAGKPEVVVKLGHVAPMTGPQAHLGKDNENGAASPSRS